jgi:dTDP-4-dehydrorhamnose reductase
MPRIVVIGRTGQVAKALGQVPLPEGSTLLTLGRDRLELTRPETFKAVLEPLAPDLLLNAAAYTAVDRAEAEEELATAVNGRAPEVLAQIAADLGVPFLHISTDYVFDGASEGPWSEGDAPNPINAYGRSKLVGERAVLDSPARAVILRTSWVFGANGRNFVKSMLRIGAERDEVAVVSDQFGGPTAAADIAETLLRIARRLLDGTPGGGLGLYHYSGAPDVSWSEFADEIFARAHWLPRRPSVRRIGSDQYAAAARRPACSALDCTKIKRDYGIDRPDWRQALARTLAELHPGAGSPGNA